MNSDHAFSPHATASPPVFKPMSSPITEVRVREVVDAWAPPGCSLRIALDLHARSTEGHLLYAWATHLGLVAALIGGKLHDGRLFPGAGVSGSLWVILVGASARSRKTTSLQIQQELAQKSDPIRFLDRPGSHEALLTDLHDDADRCLYLPELGDYFAQARRGRLATTNELLVKLFDGKDERITYIKGHLTLKSPRISLLGGVTTDASPTASSATAPSYGPGGGPLVWNDGGTVFVGGKAVTEGDWPAVSPEIGRAHV